MQQSEGWVEWSFSLSEEKQFPIHCQDFNVFMAVGKNNYIKTGEENTLLHQKQISREQLHNKII